jgi:DNA-binding response OmpR family regulator
MATANGYRVLVVEDEFLICAMIADALTEQGFEVHSVANSKEALRHLARGAPCDVIFTDINLPGGVDGTDLAELARELRPGLPVVYTSGATNRIDKIKAVPNASFVAKPYDPDSVCKILRAFAALYVRTQSAAPSDQLSARNSSSQWM